MAPEARNKFGAPKFESELFWNQIYYIAESTFDIVGVFGAPRSDLAPEELCPPHYAPGWETDENLQLSLYTNKIFCGDRQKTSLWAKLQYSPTLMHVKDRDSVAAEEKVSL